MLTDERLHGADAMWIGENGDLWIPGAEMDRTATFNRGVSAVELPIRAYRLQLGLKPLRN